MTTPTDQPDGELPAPEERIIETTETVVETLPPAPHDPDDDEEDES